jgi:plastocyanin
MVNNKKIIIISLFILLALTLIGCKKETTGSDNPTTGLQVDITADNCPNIVLNANQQVTWRNQDNKEHIVRDNTAEKTSQFDSDTLQPGDSFSYTFSQAGTYTYDCTPNGSTGGTITVE